MRKTKTSKTVTHVKRKRSASHHAHAGSGNHHLISGNAIQLIDEVADLLKRGVLFSSKKGLESRRLLEKKTKVFIHRTTDRLTKAANHGLRMAAKSLNK